MRIGQDTLAAIVPVGDVGIFLDGLGRVKLDDIVDVVGNGDLDESGLLLVRLQAHYQTCHLELLVEVAVVLDAGLKLYLLSLYQLVYPHVYFLTENE